MDLLIKAMKRRIITDFSIRPFFSNKDFNFVTDSNKEYKGLEIRVEYKGIGDTLNLQYIITNVEIELSRFDIVKYQIEQMIKEIVKVRKVRGEILDGLE